MREKRHRLQKERDRVNEELETQREARLETQRQRFTSQVMNT